MKVRFLYTAECPSHEEALERLRSVLREESVAVDVEIARVETFAEAEKERYPGSPTILVNGRDICSTQAAHYAPTCRVYLLENGRISPLPSISMIRRAIREARKDASPAERIGTEAN